MCDYKKITKQNRQEELLFAVNSAATVLLETTEENFETSLLEGMELMGRCVSADRVYIMRNETIDGKPCFIYIYDWVNETGKTGTIITRGLTVPYDDVFPDWETTLARGECLNGPMSQQPPSIQKYFSRIVIKSLLVIPVFIQGKFWGLFSFTDCQMERAFTEDEVNILRSGALMMVSGINRNLQDAELRKAQQFTQVLLDAMPFSCQLWNRDYQIFDCNEETVKMLKAENKQSFIDRFHDFSPEYQSDGKSSKEKAAMLVRKAFDEGGCVFEWMHRQSDGTPVPMEVSLVRIPHGKDSIVAAYGRDLREYKQMMNEIERRDNLSRTTNMAAEILLQSEIGEFIKDLYKVMALAAKAVNVDRVRIWKNNSIGGRLYCTMFFEWKEDTVPKNKNESVVGVSYNETIPGWKEKLSRGECINSLVRDMSETERNNFSSMNILSIFAAPVFVQNEFWGFVSYDDCHRERAFTPDEQSIMRSVSLLMTSAWLRSQMTLEARNTAVRQKAVFSNYQGIIFCVNRVRAITLFDGLYLYEQGKSSSFFEGKKTDEVLRESWSSGINESVQKTFTEGRQDTNVEIDGRTFRIRTTPIYDETRTITYVIGSFDDITERTKLQADLKAALKEAQDANRAKSHFLANMSHEMRTPLNAIIGLSELTLEDEAMSEEVRENLIKISNSGATLLSTVNDILDISKIEAGKFELIPVDYDTPSLINDTVTQSIMRIGEKPIQFFLDISENLPARLHGDDLRVKQIMNNLLSNAFKYTREGHVELKVSCEREGDSDTVWMTVQVSDTGIGIKKEDIKRLFTDYAMMDVESNRKIEGTGLGLTITKNIAEMMDGFINVDSEYGKGSVFMAKLRQKYVTDVVIGPELANSLKNFRYIDQKRRRNSRMARVNLSYAKVLIVDDVPTNLDVAKGMLKPYKMQVDCVTSGQEAIDAIRAEKVKYNAILMDHMMPGMDGIKATHIIREEIGTEYAKTVPIIALTANAIVGNEEMFLKNGFQAFIAKPIEMSRLDAVIRQWVRDKELEKSLPDYAAEQPEENPQEIPEWISSSQLEGVDTQKGFERFNHDTESFLNVLRSYAINTPVSLDTIKDVNKDNLASYAIEVHGIKGSSRGICAEAIGAKAEALEKAAKQGDLDFVIANNADLIEAAGKLINNIKELLNKITAESPKPKKDKPDKELLSKLLAACDQFNMDEADTVMKEIDCYEYDSDEGLAIWLRDNVEMMNYAEVKEKLSGLIGS